MVNSYQLIAGMPSFHLSDIAKMRLDAISFFLLGLLLSAWGVQVLWNLLSRDIPQISRIRYSTSLAGTILWGLLFMLVLTMISGARELMTPGAWQKNGYTYVLQDDGDNSPASEPVDVIKLQTKRRARLELLRTMLWAFAAAHEGNFPESIETSGIAEELWQQPGTVPATYAYSGGGSVDSERERLVLEYAVYEDGSQWQLFTDGAIEEITPKATVDEVAISEEPGSGA